MSGGTALVRRGAAAARQRVLRRRRVRAGLRAPHPDRAARRGRLADGPDHAPRDGEHVAGHRRQPARHHGLLAGARRRRRARGRAPGGAGARTPLHVPESLLHPISFVIALAIVVYLHVVLGEMIPKNIALAGPDRAALVLGPPIWGVVTVLRPVIVVINAIASAILRLFGVRLMDEVLVVVHPRGGRRARRGVARGGADRGPRSTTGWPARSASPRSRCRRC